jgi:dolichol-phosphate mannosyltransferase
MTETTTLQESDMSAVIQSVSIVVPTLNEAENIPVLVSAILKSGGAFREIVFVDDRSEDGTQEVIRSLAREHPIRLIERPAGEFGLASAIMTGARAAEGDLLLVMDADLSHPPERIGDLLAPLQDNTADMVIGSRYVKGGTTPGWPLWRRTLSRVGAAFAYPLTGARDSMSGFFAISRAQLLELDAPVAGFKLAFETIVRSKRNLRVREIPIAFRDRARGQSKMSFAVALKFFALWLRAILWRAFGSNKAQQDRHRSTGS